MVAVSVGLVSLAGAIGLALHTPPPVTVSANYIVPADHLHVFPNINGPTAPSVLPVPTPTGLGRYGVGSPSRLAILLTDRKSNWLGLAHGLKSLGVPFMVTEDYREALRHRVVMVYPTISGRVLTADALKGLAAHPRGGGTLIGTGILGGGLQEVFGFQDVQTSQDHYVIRLSQKSPLLASFTDPKETVIRLGDRSKRVLPLGTDTFIQPKEEPLARYEDGSAAIIERSYGTGHTYGFGLDVGFLILKGHNLRDEGIAESYDNRFEPVLDVVLRLLREMYLAGEPDAALLHPVPYQRRLSVLLTHDIDAQASMGNAVRYAEFERSEDIVGTYFIQTKYIKDFNDEIFFNEQGVRDMRHVQRLGMELASHSVAHSKVLFAFPLGSGSEQYPTYTPFVMARTAAANGSILGELRVSKFLIEQLSGGASVLSFRPGELSNPKALPEALMATGYKYSSSATANNSLTHLPYRLMMHRGEETEADIFEFPVTIEDEELPEMGARLPQAVELARKIARYGGSVIVLIHPNILGHKLEFEKRFVAAVKDMAWFASVGQFGAWWASRDEVGVDVAVDGARRILLLDIPSRLAGLTVSVPQSWILLQADQPGAIHSQGPGFVVLGDVTGPLKLAFHKGRTPSGATM
ncbi:MAG: hypothetical protein ICV75_02475 [Nitrospiraceae bacterium]|nr:hypothetical protein [Nitrospiraceae bacterium]